MQKRSYDRFCIVYFLQFIYSVIGLLKKEIEEKYILLISLPLLDRGWEPYLGPAEGSCCQDQAPSQTAGERQKQWLPGRR